MAAPGRTGRSLSKPTVVRQLAQRPSRVEMPEQNNDYRVVVFGAGGVGKTSLVLRFVKGTFREQYVPTIEDTYRQVISCSKQVCTLLITDTTGSHQFPAMQKLSMSKGHAFVLVYSVTSKQSLEELKLIHADLLRTKSSLEDIPVILIANKCDEPLREVSTQEGQACAKKLNCAYIETSAKMNSNVKEAFEQLLALEKRRNISLAPVADTQKLTTKRRLKNSCSTM